jgi:dipeptidyl aminopeptidase/acylaminoacyl peptidase
MSVVPGSRLGPYEIVAPIGAGGMGEVFHARDTRLDRSVAIKMLPAELATNSQLKARFEREARTISQLNHPNICTLFDVGDDFIVMELLDGETLADRISRGPLPLDQVMRLGAQIASALDKAHRAGVVHRDLKPANIMLTKSGAKLLDFGLAKTSGIIVLDGATAVKPLTEEGTILGTFHYMAPEQLEGVDVDHRADIFAFGAILYEMTTGRRAFAAASKTSLIAAIVSAQPQPVSQLQPLTPPALDHVIHKCLCKDRDERWQSAHDVAEELQWISEAGSHAGVAAPLLARKKSRQHLAWTAAIVLAVAATLAAAKWLHIGAPEPRRFRFSIPMIGPGYRFGTNIALTPDGRSLYFRAQNNAKQQQLFRRAFEEANAAPVAGTEGLTSFGLSSDAKNIFLAMPGNIVRRMSIDGGPMETVGRFPFSGAGGATAPDGTVILGSGETPIQRFQTDGKLIAITSLAKNEIGHLAPHFLPDGKTFLFVTVEPDPDRGDITHTLCAAKLGSIEVTRIAPIPSRVQYANGHLFYVRDGTLMAQPFDAATLKFTGESVAVAEGVYYFSHTATASFAVSADGSTIAYQSLDTSKRIVWVDANGRETGSVAAPDAYAPWLALTADGKRAAVSVQDAHTGIVSIWLFGLQRETRARLTSSNAWESAPSVTHDGQRVIFSSDQLGKPPDIFQAPVDGGERPKLLLARPSVQFVRDVSPDDRWILYSTAENVTMTKTDLWLLPLGGGEPRPFVETPGNDAAGSFSPDGKWIAYQSDVSGTPQVYLKPFGVSGAARQVSTKGGREPRFSPDGRRLYLTETNKFFAAEILTDGNAAEPTLLFELPAQILAYRPASSGDRFLMILVTDEGASQPAHIITSWTPPRK